MKSDPFKKKCVRSVAFAFYGAPASIDGISSNDSGDYEFLRRHMGFLALTEYGFSPNAAAADNISLGVGTHPSLLTIQSVRMSLKFDGFPTLFVPMINRLSDASISHRPVFNRIFFIAFGLHRISLVRASRRRVIDALGLRETLVSGA